MFKLPSNSVLVTLTTWTVKFSKIQCIVRCVNLSALLIIATWSRQVEAQKPRHSYATVTQQDCATRLVTNALIMQFLSLMSSHSSIWLYRQRDGGNRQKDRGKITYTEKKKQMRMCAAILKDRIYEIHPFISFCRFSKAPWFALPRWLSHCER